jgi:hypothetical protein
MISLGKKFENTLEEKLEAYKKNLPVPLVQFIWNQLEEELWFQLIFNIAVVIEDECGER